MSKKNFLTKFLSFLIWLAGVVVSLAVAFGMINGILVLPKWLGGILITKIFGWIVVCTTFLGILISGIKLASK